MSVSSGYDFLKQLAEMASAKFEGTQSSLMKHWK